MKRGLKARLQRTLADREPGASASATPGDVSATPGDVSGHGSGEPPPSTARAASASLGLAARLAGESTLAWRLQGLTAPDRVPTPLDEALEVRRQPGPFGHAVVLEERLPLSSVHGDRRLGALYRRPTRGLDVLTGDPKLRDFDASQALFLDIEATGLEHGPGTFAFLIGLGYREGDALVVRQLLLTDPSQEQAQLHALLELLDRFPLLVSFNGKSYDLSVLQTRMVLHRFMSRREVDLKLRPHLDLLHLARNLYRGLWDDTRLGTCEREVLGFTRVDDVPGSLVPSLWYHYLRTADAAPLKDVVTHNRHDVVSMVTLTERLLADADLTEVGGGRGDAAEAEAEPEAGAATEAAAEPEAGAGAAAPDPRVWVNLGRLLLRRKAPSLARGPLSLAAAAPLPRTPWRRDALELLATACRRTGDPAGQRAALEELTRAFPQHREGLIALSIVRDRLDRAPAEALALARRALALGRDAATERRVARLEARVARLARAGAGG